MTKSPAVTSAASTKIVRTRVDPDLGVGGKAGTDARDLLSLADPRQSASPAGRLAGRLWLVRSAGVHRADLVEDFLDLVGGDEPVAGPWQRREPVADRAFEVAQDLGAVRVIWSRPSARSR